MKKTIALALSGAILASTCAYAKEFIRGGDISSLSYIEDLGGKYYDQNGVERDALEILAQSGMNMARIRLSNNPGKGRGDGTYYLPDGYQNESDCLDLARRAKAAGMGIQFTFNYSDYWSNGSRQIIPSDWVNMIKSEKGYDISDPAFLNAMTAEERAEIISALEKIIYDYTYDIMSKLKAQDTVPEYVSPGNEINGGLLFPFANTYDAFMNSKSFELMFGDAVSADDIKCPVDWSALARFINAGYTAVKEVSPESQVVIHLASGWSKDGSYQQYIWDYEWFLGELKKHGAKYDVIGSSYYPSWTNTTIETYAEFCNIITKEFDKDILVMETGFNWNEVTTDGYGGQLSDIDAYKNTLPPTQDGHYGYMKALFEGLRSVENNRCIGSLYWDPLMIHVDDGTGKSLSGWAYRESDGKAEKNVVENTTLFDFNGKAIKSLDAFREDMEANRIMIISPTYDENGRLTDVTINRSDKRDEDSAKDGDFVWDYEKIKAFGM